MNVGCISQLVKSHQEMLSCSMRSSTLLENWEKVLAPSAFLVSLRCDLWHRRMLWMDCIKVLDVFCSAIDPKFAMQSFSRILLLPRLSYLRKVWRLVERAFSKLTIIRIEMIVKLSFPKVLRAILGAVLHMLREKGMPTAFSSLLQRKVWP